MSLEVQLFDQNLLIKKLNEKIEYLAGGTSAAEMLDILRERDEEVAKLENGNKKLKEKLELCEKKLHSSSAQYKCLASTLEIIMKKNVALSLEIKNSSESHEIQLKEQELRQQKAQSDIENKTIEMSNLISSHTLTIQQLETKNSELERELEQVILKNSMLSEQLAASDSDILRSAREDRENLLQNNEQIVLLMRQVEKCSSNTVEVLKADLLSSESKLENAVSQVKKLEKRYRDVQAELLEKDRKIDLQKQAEKKITSRSKSELEALRVELGHCRTKVAESLRFAGENAELKAKIERQETYMRKLIDEKKSKSAPFSSCPDVDSNIPVEKENITAAAFLSAGDVTTKDKLGQYAAKSRVSISNHDKNEIRRKRMSMKK